MARGKRLKKRNSRRLPLRAWALYLALVAFALTGVTFSRYVAGTQLQEQARVAAFGALTVADSGTVLLQPGVSADKTVEVQLESSEVACFLFIRVDGDGWQRETDPYNFQYGKNLLSWRVDSGWTYLTEQSGAAVYYREVPVNTAVSLPVIEGDAVTVSELVTRSQLQALPADLGIRVQATAAQRQGTETPLEAWNTVK